MLPLPCGARPAGHRWGRACLLALLGAMLTFAALADTLKVGFHHLPVHAYLDDAGQPTGAAVSYFKGLADKMGVDTVSFQQLPLGRLLVLLESGEIDAALFMGKTPDRVAKFYFPPVPYYLAQPAVAVATTSPLMRVQTADDLKGLKIGVFKEGYQSSSIQKNSQTLELAMGDNIDLRNLQRTLMGRLDAIYSPDIAILRSLVYELGVEQRIRILPLPDPALGVYTIFSSKAAARYGAKYTETLAGMVKAGDGYERQLQKQLKYAP